jgi:hypothetical protein
VYAGASVGSEVSANNTDDYSNLVSQLQGLCFGFMGEGGQEGTQHEAVSPQERCGSTSSGPAFELDLGGTGQLGTPNQVSMISNLLRNPPSLL